MSVKIFVITCAVLILGLVIELIRREKLTFQYALTWLCTSLAVLALAVFDGVLYRLAHAAGFVLTSNFIFFLLLLFVVFLSLLLTLYANEQNKRTEILTQSLAILEYRLREIESRSPPENTASPAKSY